MVKPAKHDSRMNPTETFPSGKCTHTTKKSFFRLLLSSSITSLSFCTDRKTRQNYIHLIYKLLCVNIQAAFSLFLKSCSKYTLLTQFQWSKGINLRTRLPLLNGIHTLEAYCKIFADCS